MTFGALCRKSRMTKREAVDARKPQALSHEGKEKVAEGATFESVCIKNLTI